MQTAVTRREDDAPSSFCFSLSIHEVTVWFKSQAVNWPVYTQLDEARCSHWLGVYDLLPPLSAPLVGQERGGSNNGLVHEKRNKGKTRAPVGRI